MDLTALSNLTGEQITMGLILLVLVWKGFDLLKDFIMAKTKKDNSSEDEIKKLIASIQAVMEQVVIAITKNNEKIDNMRRDLDKTNVSALQAVAIMSEGGETMKDKVNEIRDEIRRISR